MNKEYIMKPRARAIAIAAVQENPFSFAFSSAKNCLSFLADFMYGTPQRVCLTYLFAIGLAALGYLLQTADANALAVCIN
jgi:hypothetical protein